MKTHLILFVFATAAIVEVTKSMAVPATIEITMGEGHNTVVTGIKCTGEVDENTGDMAGTGTFTATKVIPEYVGAPRNEDVTEIMNNYLSEVDHILDAVIQADGYEDVMPGSFRLEQGKLKATVLMPGVLTFTMKPEHNGVVTSIKCSGIVAPIEGEEATRGFFLAHLADLDIDYTDKNHEEESLEAIIQNYLSDTAAYDAVLIANGYKNLDTATGIRFEDNALNAIVTRA